MKFVTSETGKIPSRAKVATTLFFMGIKWLSRTRGSKSVRPKKFLNQIQNQLILKWDFAAQKPTLTRNQNERFMNVEIK